MHPQAIFQIAGAVYLVGIGVQSLRSVRRAADPADAPDGADPAKPALGRSGFTAGFLTDILNPKGGVFFVTFLPGFIPHGYSVGWTTAVFGVLFIGLTALYFAGLVGVSATIATWMSTARIRRRLDALTGLVLVGFGLRLATEA